MEEREKTREELEEELKTVKEEFNIQSWGVAKTNDAIKVLYKELEKKNKELRELDKMKSDFINTVSHELRTPLTTIREAVSQVLDGILGETTPRQKEYLSFCLEDVDRLKRIIDDLLDVSKLEAGKFTILREEVDIKELVKKVIAIFEPKVKNKNLEVKENFSDEKVLAYVDRDGVFRVFTNLIGNAIKFTDKGCIEISVTDKQDTVECVIADTGRGIAEEDIPRLFNKFQQFGRTGGGGEKGTGLGLNICKSIIELHHGKIWADSFLDKGTRFTFTLPKYRAGQLYNEYIDPRIKNAIREREPLSIFIFGIKDFKAASRKIEKEKISFIMQNLENFVKQGFCKAEIVIKDIETIIAVCPGADKAAALAVIGNVREDIGQFLSKEKTNADVEIFSEVVNYPEDGVTAEEIRARITDILLI